MNYPYILLNKKVVTDEELKEQHLADGNKVLKYLVTAQNNTEKPENIWQGFVKARIEHVHDFIKELNKAKKDLEHFK